jgi:glycosyltransferase involved in cell wall biosynthesis
VPILASSASVASTLNSRKAERTPPPSLLPQPKSKGRSPDSGAPRVAFIVQRCGRQVNGGAESHCLQVAQHMAKHWQTEVLTTCALDYMSWENFYSEGPEQIGPTLVRRFLVDQPRNVETFNQLSTELHSRQPDTTLSEQETWMRAQGPISTRLLDYLRANKHSYDAFIFFGYLYATTYFGLPLVADKAWLAPLAHDEWPIYFSMWDALFSLPQGFIFNSEDEREFLQDRFNQASLSGPTIGVGVEAPPVIDVEVFKARYKLVDPFLLYVGRIDESKGCGTMFQHFLRWKREVGTSHKLVLLGKEVMPIPFHDDIIHLGFVDDEQKWAAMKACDWLIMPSPYESLSMALLEIWSVGRPALVTAESAVLVSHCQASQGGLYYNGFDEWCAALAVADHDTKCILGDQGRKYVRERYSWARVTTDYLNLFG